MLGVEPSEQGARVRAARGYKGLSVPAMAKVLGVSESTLKRIEAGTASAEKDGRLEAIIAATGVPPEFFEVGFAPLERPLTDVGRRVYQLEARFADFTLTLIQLADDATRGDLDNAALRLRELAQRLGDPPPPSILPVEDAHTDSGG